MKGSIKSRMLRALSVWIVVAWTTALIAIYVFSTYGQTSIWDDKLQSVAIKLLQMAPADISADRPDTDAQLLLPPDIVAHNHELTFQLWKGSKLIAATPGAPAAPLRTGFAPGFVNVDIGGEDWRVYSVSDRSGAFHVQVGNARDMINADFQKHSLKVVSIAIIPLALAGLLMWWSLSRALKPLATIEAAARGRSKFDLTPLPTSPLPSELQPLVSSFNHLLLHLDQAIQAERRFISDAAHELRTPLAALQAQVEVAMRAKSEAEREIALAKLLVAVQRNGRLAEQLLDLARLDAGSHAPSRDWVDLNDVVRHVANEFEFNAQRRQRSIELATAPCLIRCDVDEMGILVRNLVDNALRYTFNGGKVRISCGYLGEGAESDSAFLEVADDGPGVPVESHAVMFERFRRVPGGHAVRGSGIGLSLVARIANMHDARIETGDGIGTAGLSVRLLFPLSAEVG